MLCCCLFTYSNDKAIWLRFLAKVQLFMGVLSDHLPGCQSLAWPDFSGG